MTNMHWDISLKYDKFVLGYFAFAQYDKLVCNRQKINRRDKKKAWYGTQIWHAEGATASVRRYGAQSCNNRRTQSAQRK